MKKLLLLIVTLGIAAYFVRYSDDDIPDRETIIKLINDLPPVIK